jgi:hypothetical protein
MADDNETPEASGLQEKGKKKGEQRSKPPKPEHCGTAMGTKVAPSYANLFLGKLEKELLAGYHLKSEIWIRYINDKQRTS